MEGVGELIIVKTETKLKGELVEAYKTIAEKEAEIQRLLEKVTLLEMRNPQSEKDCRELEREAEEIIPKECWGMVFQNLDADDLLSCRQVCKTFKQLLDLKEFEVKWKFHLILPQLFLYLKTDPDSKTWEHLYNARLACRSWRHSIDKYASEVHGKSFFPLPETREMPLVIRFRTSEDIEEFQEKFGDSDKNPFPSRSVCIEKPDDEEVDDDECVEYFEAQTLLQGVYIQKVGDLLEQFGKHIFRLRLCFDYEQIFGPDALTLCKLIRRITIHLPNLKELQIYNDSGFEKDKEEVAAMYVVENALAALPKLRALKIYGLDKIVGDYLLDAFGPQLTQLETPSSEDLSQFQMQQLRNLRKLWLELDEPSDTLELLRFLESPLELLKLTCRFDSLQGTWNVDKVLRNLKHLPIELLEIDLWTWDQVNLAEAGIGLEEYQNSSIKTLIIQIDRPDSADSHQISFNFLQALIKLENLEFKVPRVQLRSTHPEELAEVVKLSEYLFGDGGTDKIYDSNVWEKVASLKTLTSGHVKDHVVNKSIFTREKYERRIIA